MREIYTDRYHYSNPNVRPHNPMTDYTCASGALHVAYQAFDFHYSENQIVHDLGKGYSDGVSWNEMMDHAESNGFDAAFYHGLDFDTLSCRLYKVPYVIIVGWIAYEDPVDPMYHCSPIRFANSKSISLTQLGEQGLMKMAKEDFLPVWHDCIHEHPFMTLRKRGIANCYPVMIT